MTDLFPVNFHSSEWKFSSLTSRPRSAPDEDPLLRVEVHRVRRRPTFPSAGTPT